MLYLGLISILLSGICLYFLYKKNTAYWNYQKFYLRNTNLILKSRSNFSSKLSDLSKAIDLYKQTQNGYFLKEDIDYSSIQNMKKFMELYDINKKNHKEAKDSYFELIDIIEAEYESLIGEYYQDLLKSSYDLLIEELKDFDNAIISLYKQADTFMDTIKSVYDSVLKDKIILESLLEDAVSNEEYLEAADLRDIINSINS
jgi:hypothetical protein